MSSLYFVIAIMALPLFAFQLYKKVEGYPLVFSGEEGKCRAKKVCITFIIFTLLDGCFLLRVFPAEVMANLKLIIPIFMGSSCVVSFLIYQTQLSIFAGDLLNKGFKNKKQI